MLCWIEAHPGTAAWLQAGGSILALIIAIGFPLWQQWKVRKRELAALRLAFYTEVRIAAHNCLQLLELRIAGHAAHKDPRLSRMPLPVFQGNSGKIGLLTTAEIVSLLNFASVLSDMMVLASDLPMGEASVQDLEQLSKRQATACKHAAKFLAAVPNPPDADIQEFIEKLNQATSTWS